MLCDRKSRQAFLNAAEMLAEAFSKSPACFTDVDGEATAARDGIYQARRLTGESILDGNCALWALQGAVTRNVITCAAAVVCARRSSHVRTRLATVSSVH